MCRASAARAAQKTGVPLAVLLAISLTETGRRLDGQTSPWPWTLNVEGKGYWLDGETAALELAQRTLAAGTKSFDVGCFQLNYRWHGAAFSSLNDMLNPDQNALYAARFLADLFQETGDWSRAAGHYHSRTQAFADRYRRTFDTHLAAMADMPLPDLVELAPGRAPRENLYPLLQTGAAPSELGSLMPRHISNQGGLFANRTTKPFWSGS
ncbi:hypothetical protein BV911_11380 [Pseudoruegeria sp. SK021]|nr:hypothetical protein BV911_11380 [Pseudoruegeria sp. SK021]